MKAEHILPIMRPSPPRLSEHLQELKELEASGVYTNFGPVNTRLESELVRLVFGEGGCLTVCNATNGLMLAIREVMGEDRPGRRRYALMPSFTFAAAAQAALWCGLTPLLCDIDPHTWLPSADSEEELLRQYAGEVAVVVPYATFGNNLDLPRYERLAQTHGVPVVVDAAASLGSQTADGTAFGTGFPWPVVFSMHATKTFSAGEGGVIYCADEARLERLRTMCGFGFGQPRSATMPGLNAKLSEVAALTGLLQLRRMHGSVEHRFWLSKQYARRLPTELQHQRRVGVQVKAFESALLPKAIAPERSELQRLLEQQGIGSATYFSPHLAEQPYLARHATMAPLPVTQDVASRVLTLPLHAEMTVDQVERVGLALKQALVEVAAKSRSLPIVKVRRVLPNAVPPPKPTQTPEHVLPAA